MTKNFSHYLCMTLKFEIPCSYGRHQINYKNKILRTINIAGISIIEYMVL